MFPGLVRRSKLSPTREAGAAARLDFIAWRQLSPYSVCMRGDDSRCRYLSTVRSILSPLQRRALRWKKAYVLSLPYAAYQHSAPCSRRKMIRSRRHLALGGPRGNGGWSQYLWIIFKSSPPNDLVWVLCILDLRICIFYG